MISLKHKAIFIHIPKCAGQSIEDIFIKENGLTWKSREPLLLRPNYNPLVGPPFLAHLTYQEYLKYRYATVEMMNTFNVFSVVRNPYSRLESIYKYRGYSSAVTFDYFIANVVINELHPEAKNYYFFRPQVDYLIDDDGQLGVKSIFKVEAIDEIIAYLRSMNIFLDQVPRVNKYSTPTLKTKLSQRVKAFRDGYYSIAPIVKNEVQWNSKLRGIVNKHYERDFDLFDYKML